MPGVLAQLPGSGPRFVPLAEEVLACAISEVANCVRNALRLALGFVNHDKEEDEEQEQTDFRLLFRERDLDDELPAAAFLKALKAGMPCTVRVLFRLLGGKGGFGALLRGQKGKGKKTTNLDAMRDLSGRRLRHSKAVERIKEWMEKQKRDDELVNLLTGEGPELPKPTPRSETLDPEYIRLLKRTAAQRESLVAEGLQRRSAPAASPDDSEPQADPVKRPCLDGPAESSSSGPRVDAGTARKGADSYWLSALDALGSLSSPEHEDEASDGEGHDGATSGTASASAAKATSAEASN